MTYDPLNGEVFDADLMPHTAELKPYAGKNGFGKPTYKPARWIRCRKEPARGVTRSATGTDYQVETYYQLDEDIRLEDLLDGRPVRRVKPRIALEGHAIGAEAWV